MKITFLVIIITFNSLGYAQHRKETNTVNTEKFLKHAIGLETQVLGFDKSGKELSYRYYLSKKWNIKFSSRFLDVYSWRTYDNIEGIIDSQTYLSKQTANSMSSVQFNFGLERNFKVKDVILFLGAYAGCGFNNTDIKIYTYGRSINDKKIINDYGGYYIREANHFSLGLDLTAGLQYKIAKNFSGIIKMDNNAYLAVNEPKVKERAVNYDNQENYRALSFIKANLYLGLLFRV